MKIIFELGWLQKNVSLSKAFKSASTAALFEEFQKRISAYHPLSFRPAAPKTGNGIILWACDFHAPAKPISTETLAQSLQQLLNGGTKEWRILIGGPDGITTKELKPDFIWSFGPLTLPHELAAVIAAEQVYRAFTILHHHPYHSGH